LNLNHIIIAAYVPVSELLQLQPQCFYLLLTHFKLALQSTCHIFVIIHLLQYLCHFVFVRCLHIHYFLIILHTQLLYFITNYLHKSLFELPMCCHWNVNIINIILKMNACK